MLGERSSCDGAASSRIDRGCDGLLALPPRQTPHRQTDTRRAQRGLKKNKAQEIFIGVPSGAYSSGVAPVGNDRQFPSHCSGRSPA